MCLAKGDKVKGGEWVRVEAPRASFEIGRHRGRHTVSLAGRESVPRSTEGVFH